MKATPDNNDIQDLQKPTETKIPTSKTPDAETSNVRNHLAMMIVALVAILALVATVQTEALPILQLLLPIIGAIVAFYFGGTTKT